MATKYVISYSADRKIKQTIRYDDDPNNDFLEVQHELQLSPGMSAFKSYESPSYDHGQQEWDDLKSKYQLDQLVDSQDKLMEFVYQEKYADRDSTLYKFFPSSQTFYILVPKMDHVVNVEYQHNLTGGNTSKTTGEAL